MKNDPFPAGNAMLDAVLSPILIDAKEDSQGVPPGSAFSGDTGWPHQNRVGVAIVRGSIGYHVGGTPDHVPETAMELKQQGCLI